MQNKKCKLFQTTTKKRANYSVADEVHDSNLISLKYQLNTFFNLMIPFNGLKSK